MIFFIHTAFAQTVGAAKSSGSSWMLPVIVAALILCVVAFIVLRIFSRKQHLHSDPNYRKYALLITVPKELSVSDQEAFGQSADPIQRLIAVADNLFAFLGGVKAQRWYQSLTKGRTDHFSLEIIAHRGVIGFYIVVPGYMREFVERQVQAQYTTAQVEEVQLPQIISPDSVVVGAALKQKKSFIYPMLTYHDMQGDPIVSITNVLSRLQTDESLAIQYIVRSANPSWHDRARSFIRNVQTGKGSQMSVPSPVKGIATEVFRTFVPKKNPQDQLSPGDYRPTTQEERLIEEVAKKNSKAGLEVNVRVVAVSPHSQRVQVLLKNAVDSFSQFTNYDVGGNGFLRADPMQRDRIVRDYIHRRFDPSRQCVLSTDEMASLWHLPTPWTETPNILWLTARKASVPPNVPITGLLLGKNVYRGVETEIRILPEDRRRHIYIIGKSGVGKSVLMQSMAIQDIQQGHGVCVIDPHGDLVEHIIGHVPKERAEDVIYFNPSDIERPVGLNMLEASTPDERDFSVQEMIAIFYKLFPPEMIGPIFEHNMRNVMLTLMEGKPVGTIAEIPRMFTDTAFQKSRVAHVTDPVVRSFWEKEMAKTADFHKSEMLGYIISKVGRFVENSMMRNIIGQTQSGFDFSEVMDKQKILLVNLSKGTTGEVNSALLGLIIVSKLQMAALRRASKPEEERKDFYLYIDEFQNFVTDSIATILSEARKYRLDMTIAHQYINQLVNGQDTKIRDAVFGNAGTMVAFRVGVEDAEYISKEFEPVFSSLDLVNLDRYSANVKLLVHNTASRPFTMQTAPPKTGSRDIAAVLKELSRLKYGRDRKAVEAEIFERTQLGASSGSQPMSSEPRI